jgi:hypothetical protein
VTPSGVISSAAPESVSWRSTSSGVATMLMPVTAPPSRIAASAPSVHARPFGIWIASTSPSPKPRAASMASVRLSVAPTRS